MSISSSVEDYNRHTPSTQGSRKELKAVHDKLDQLLSVKSAGINNGYMVERNDENEESDHLTEEVQYVQGTYQQKYQGGYRQNQGNSNTYNRQTNPQYTYKPTPAAATPEPFFPNKPALQQKPPIQPTQQQAAPYYQQPTPVAQAPDYTELLQQILHGQTSLQTQLTDTRAELGGKVDTLTTRVDQLTQRMTKVEQHQASSSNVRTSCQLPGQAIANPKAYHIGAISVLTTPDIPNTHTESTATEGSVVQVGGDNLIQEEVGEDTSIFEDISSPPDPTLALEKIVPTVEREHIPQLKNNEAVLPATQNETTTKEKSAAFAPPPYETHVPFPQRFKEVMEAQCEVLFNYKTCKFELTTGDMRKSSNSSPRNASEYCRKAPMYEEVVDGESFQDMFAREETINSPPEKLCRVPALDPEPDILVRPLESIKGGIEIMDETVAENAESAHLSVMKIENSVPINTTISEETSMSFTIAECQSLRKHLAKTSNVFMVKLHQDEAPPNNSTSELSQHKLTLCPTKHQICSVTGLNLHLPEGKLAGIFGPCYADSTNHLVVENVANKLDEHMEKQHFENVDYSFKDEPTSCKRVFNDSFENNPHTRTKRWKWLQESYMPVQKQNMYDDESKLHTPKVKMKPLLIEVSKRSSPSNYEPKGKQDPPWKGQKVEMHWVAEPKWIPPPLPPPPPLPDPPPFPTSSLK